MKEKFPEEKIPSIPAVELVEVEREVSCPKIGELMFGPFFTETGTIFDRFSLLAVGGGV
jgi:hypothetical protein